MKTISQLKPGDKVTLESGEVQTITKISRGFYRESSLIEWRGGWACLSNATKIQTVNP